MKVDRPSSELENLSSRVEHPSSEVKFLSSRVDRSSSKLKPSSSEDDLSQIGRFARIAVWVTSGCDLITSLTKTRTPSPSSQPAAMGRLATEARWERF